MTPTQVQIEFIASEYASAFATGEWFARLRRDAFKEGANWALNHQHNSIKAAIVAAVKHGIENCEDKGDKWNDAAAERYYHENYGS